MTGSDERIALNTIDEDLEEESTQEGTVNRSGMSNSLTRHSLVFNASDTTLHNSSSPPIRGTTTTSSRAARMENPSSDRVLLPAHLISIARLVRYPRTPIEWLSTS
jgi:hypothetical protein